MKLAHDAIEKRTGKHERHTANKPSCQDKIPQEDSPDNFHQRRIQWEEDDIGQGVILFEIIAVLDNIEIPIRIPSIMHIHKVKTLHRGKLIGRYPFVGCVRIEIESIERDEGKYIDNNYPQQHFNNQ